MKLTLKTRLSAKTSVNSLARSRISKNKNSEPNNSIVSDKSKRPKKKKRFKRNMLSSKGNLKKLKWRERGLRLRELSITLTRRPLLIKSSN